MLFVLGGLAILCGLLLLGWLFVNADPARLARNLKWAGIAVAIAVGVGLLILTEGRLFELLLPAAVLAPVVRRIWSAFAGLRGPAAGHSSTVETRFLRMSLDHDTGEMSGTVLQGRFTGMRIEELRPPELLALLRECRAEDEEAARLVEAYLDRVDPDWRDGLRGDEAAAGAGAAPNRARSDITVEEAYAILGLAPGADAEAIRAAHHRLMKQLHPDHGGTDYFAAKLNRARDVLLKATR